jgi:hypothetical protein
VTNIYTQIYISTMDAYVRRMEAAVLLASKALEKLKQQNERLRLENTRIRDLCLSAHRGGLEGQDLELKLEELDEELEAQSRENAVSGESDAAPADNVVGLDDEAAPSHSMTVDDDNDESADRGLFSAIKRHRQIKHDVSTTTPAASTTKSAVQYVIESGWTQTVRNIALSGADLEKVHHPTAAPFSGQEVAAIRTGDLVLCHAGSEDLRFLPHSLADTGSHKLEANPAVIDAAKSEPIRLPLISAVRLLFEHLHEDGVHTIAATLCKYPCDLVVKTMFTHLDSHCSSAAHGARMKSDFVHRLQAKLADTNSSVVELIKGLALSNYPLYIFERCDTIVKVIVSMATRVHNGLPYVSELLFRIMVRTTMITKHVHLLQIGSHTSGDVEGTNNTTKVLVDDHEVRDSILGDPDVNETHEDERALKNVIEAEEGDKDEEDKMQFLQGTVDRIDYGAYGRPAKISDDEDEIIVSMKSATTSTQAASTIDDEARMRDLAAELTISDEDSDISGSGSDDDDDVVCADHERVMNSNEQLRHDELAAMLSVDSESDDGGDGNDYVDDADTKHSHMPPDTSISPDRVLESARGAPAIASQLWSSKIQLLRCVAVYISVSASVTLVKF